MRRAFFIVALAVTTPSCAMLDRPIEFVDPDTGQVVSVRAGDLAAKVLEDSGASASDAVGKVVGAATGNPVVGAGAGAALLALVGTAAGALRKKKPAPTPSQQEQAS